MATNGTVSEKPEDREETMGERRERLDLEKKALRPGSSGDALPERLLALLGFNQYQVLDGDDGLSPERALFKYAAASTKAVAMALRGTDYVCSNEAFETEFTTDEAAIVLCGLSSLLEEGPDLITDIREAAAGVQP